MPVSRPSTVMTIGKMKGSAQALISRLHGWQAAEKHYFKNKKPPENMSVLIEKRILTELPCEPPGVTITLPSTTSGDAAIPQWILAAPLSARMFLFQMSFPVADSRQRNSPSAPSA